MESILKKIISRVLVWGGSEGETVSGKAKSHAKMISATHTRPQKATLVHHRPKQKCIARKWMTFDCLAKPESFLDGADPFCMNLPCKAYHDSGNLPHRTVSAVGYLSFEFVHCETQAAMLRESRSEVIFYEKRIVKQALQNFI